MFGKASLRRIQQRAIEGDGFEISKVELLDGSIESNDHPNGNLVRTSVGLLVDKQLQVEISRKVQFPYYAVDFIDNLSLVQLFGERDPEEHVVVHLIREESATRIGQIIGSSQVVDDDLVVVVNSSPVNNRCIPINILD
jgi:hypothetical protein